MKQNKFCNHILFVIGLATILHSCEPDDNEKKWGLTKVYMPQASMLDGGLTNNYPVPLNNNASTKNYKIDTETNTLKVTLGVYRSGLQDMESFSVSVGVDNAATAAALTNISRAVELPADVYSLPTSATVPNGQRETTFYLDVDLNKLIANYPSYGLNKIVLVVGISATTKYELNESLSKTIVVIDGASFLPAPKIVEGGDFEEKSEKYWTILNLSGALPDSYAVIENGVLTFDYKTATANGTKCCFTQIELVEGNKYKFSCDFISTGGSSIVSARFYLAVSSTIPVAGTPYPYNVGSSFNIILDAWNGLINPVNGTLPQKAGFQSGIDKSTGIFESNFTGTGYLVIGAAAWVSSIGTIIIDNVKIEEQ